MPKTIDDWMINAAEAILEGPWDTTEGRIRGVAAIIAEHFPERVPSSPAAPLDLSEDQIKRMVELFLQWKLPENFNPDGGISFKKTFNEHTAHPMKHEPVGTNLFDFNQAEEMIRYMAGSPAAPTPPTEHAEALESKLRNVLVEARGLMRVACRMIWAREHGLRIGRDDATDGSAYVMRLAYVLGLLPEISGSKFTEFCEQLTGLQFDATPEVWICKTCGSKYAEYINGCVHCEAAGLRSGVECEPCPNVTNAEPSMKPSDSNHAAITGTTFAKNAEVNCNQEPIRPTSCSAASPCGEIVAKCPTCDRTNIENAKLANSSMCTDSWHTTKRTPCCLKREIVAKGVCDKGMLSLHEHNRDKFRNFIRCVNWRHTHNVCLGCGREEPV